MPARIVDLRSLKTLLLGGAFLLAALGAQTNIANASAFDDPGSRTAGTGTSNGAGLEPLKDEMDGGEISVGATTQVVVLFRNTLAQPIEVGSINLYPSSTITATVAMNDCAKEPLPSGAVCPIALSVKALQTGPWRVDMLVRHSGRSKVVKMAVKGTVATGDDGDQQMKSDLQPIPDKLDFGSIESGKPLVRSIVLRNVTSETINIKDVAIQASANAEYNLETNCDKLLTGQACLISLGWAPSHKGKSEGFIVIRHDGATAVTSIPVEGEYKPEELKKASMFPESMPGKGLLVASEEKIEFGSGVASESSITLSLVNVGDADLEIQQINLSGAENGLTVLRKGCAPGRILAPVEACPLTLSWSPLRSGQIRDDLQIIHDGARGVLILPVTGTATQAINKDSKSIIERDGVVIRQVDRYQVLQGYVVSSHSLDRAIINGPGGSRVVRTGQELLLGGVRWRVNIVPTGVEMVDGKDKVQLLFDQSLSSGSRLNSGPTADTAASAAAPGQQGTGVGTTAAAKSAASGTSASGLTGSSAGTTSSTGSFASPAGASLSSGATSSTK